MAIDYGRLEKYLTREFRQYHVAAQAYRACGMFLGALGVQLATGTNDWTWKSGLAILAAAGYVTLLQLFPTVPWKKFLGHVQVAQAVEAKQIADSAVAAAAPAAPSGQGYTPVTAALGQNPQPGPRTAPTPPE